jgi:hypothetical protein
MPGLFVEGMAKRGDEVEVAAGLENALHFGHDSLGILNVLENGVAFHALERAVEKRETLRVGGNVYSGDSDDVQIDVAFDGATGSADVQIPAA